MPSPADNPLLAAGWSAQQVTDLLSQVNATLTLVHSQAEAQLQASLALCGAQVDQCRAQHAAATETELASVGQMLASHPGVLDANIIGELAVLMTYAQDLGVPPPDFLAPPSSVPAVPVSAVPSAVPAVAAAASAPASTVPAAWAALPDQPYTCYGALQNAYSAAGLDLSLFPLLQQQMSLFDADTGALVHGPQPSGIAIGYHQVALLPGSAVVPAQYVGQWDTLFAAQCGTTPNPTQGVPNYAPPAVATTPLAGPIGTPIPTFGTAPPVSPPPTPSPGNSASPPPAVTCPPPVVQCPPPTVNVNVPPSAVGGVTVIASEQAYLDSPQGGQFASWLNALLPEADPLQDEPGTMDAALAQWDGSSFIFEMF